MEIVRRAAQVFGAIFVAIFTVAFLTIAFTGSADAQTAPNLPNYPETQNATFSIAMSYCMPWAAYDNALNPNIEAVCIPGLDAWNGWPTSVAEVSTKYGIQPMVYWDYTASSPKNNGSGCDCDGGEGADGNNGSDNSMSGSTMIGDPINSAIGNKYLQQDDYVSGNSLTFRRFYNSSVALTASAMGLQWRHSFDRSLALTGSPATTAVLSRPDGKQETFTKINGVWVTDADVQDILTETDNAQGVASAYTVFIAARREFENYATSGLLQSVTDESGQVVTLTYSTASTPSNVAPRAGLLLTVTDPTGRQLNFAYKNVGQGQLSTVTLPDGHSLTYTYNANGELVSVQYPDNSIRTYVYDEPSFTGGANLFGVMTGIVDESGVRYESTTYESNGEATQTSLAGGINMVRIGYNSNGTSTVQYPLSASVTMGYTTGATGLIQSSGVNQSCGLQCNQPWQSINYDSNSRPQSYTDFNGNITTTSYNSAGLLTQQIDAKGSTNQRTTNIDWNDALRVPLARTVLDANNNTVSSTQWVYNATGRILARCDIDPTNPAATGYTCTNTGTVPAGVRRNTYTYCTTIDTTQCPLVGLLLTANGTRTDVTQTTTYSYYLTSSATSCGTPGAACYQAGDLHTVTDAAGHVTTIASYDADGRITRMTDANGVNTDLTYTPRGWLASRTVGGAQTSFTYTVYGNLQAITDPDGVVTTFGYDAAHRPIKVTDALGNYIQYTLDAAGDKTAEQVYDSTGTLHRSLTQTFNSLGQLISVMDGLNHTVFSAATSTSYDGNGNLVQSSDGLNIQRRLGYDALNRLVQAIENYGGADTATQNTKIAYQYDSLDRLTQVTDPGSLNTTYGYNGLNDATSQISPDTGTSSRTFDAAGNVLTSTDAKGIVATNTYDPLDRLVSTSYPDNTQNVTYSYDDANSVTNCSSSYPIGRLTRIIENSATTVYCYDARGNVIEKQQIFNGATDTTGYSISAAGRLSSVVYPSGTQISYTRDGDGRIQSVSVTTPGSTTAVTVVSNVTYQPFGPISGYTLGNGQAITRVYDGNYRLTDLTSAAFTLHLARDAMGDITAIGNASGANPATEMYAYDPLYRLTTVTEAGGSVLENVTYNQTGDRLTKAASGLDTGSYTYAAGTHQLTGVGSQARTLDADGNTTGIAQASGAYGFGYSNRNVLTIAQLAGSTVGTYTYNALRQRIGKAGSNSVRYDYDEAQRLMGEYGAYTRDYVWMGDVPVAVVDVGVSSSSPAPTCFSCIPYNGNPIGSIGGSSNTGTMTAINYVYADGLGAPRAVTNSAGTVIWRWAYQGNPWGEMAPTSTGSYALNLRFAGQYYDQETGLIYNVNRYYEAPAGRYVQSDPIGLQGGISTYAYVANSPLDGIDPLAFACNARGCWNTADELASADIGDYAGYYAKACAGGDPYACRAGEVATDTGNGLRGMLSEVTNRKLSWSIAMHQALLCPEQYLRNDMRRKMQSIRHDLMKARINQLSGGTPENPIQVNRQDISAFHHAVFDQNGAGADAFGGDLWDITHLQGVTHYNWCEFPACKP